MNSYSPIEQETQETGYLKLYSCRVIPKSILDIKYDTHIYNDVTAYVYYYRDENFGIEIQNKVITESNRQMFEVLWKQATIPNIPQRD